MSSKPSPTAVFLGDSTDSSSPSPSPEPHHKTARSRSQILKTPTSASTSTSTITDKAEPPNCDICLFPTGTRSLAPSTKVERLASLPCGHAFGHLCVLHWLHTSSTPSCPMCRRVFVHSGCGHIVMPALMDRHPAFLLSTNKTSPHPELEEICILCSGIQSPFAELLRLERRKVECARESLAAFSEMPELVALVPSFDRGMLHERLSALEVNLEELESEWMLCQDNKRNRW